MTRFGQRKRPAGADNADEPIERKVRQDPFMRTRLMRSTFAFKSGAGAGATETRRSPLLQHRSVRSSAIPPFCKTLAALFLSLTIPVGMSAAQEGKGRPSADVTYSFNIPAGPLEAALQSFQTVTGRQIGRLSLLASMPGLTSGGVTGAYPASVALSKLLAGTPFEARLTGAGAFELQIAVTPERVDVTAPSPYRPEYSAIATKTPTPLLDIPQTLTVVPREVLFDEHAQSMGDAIRNVPGVSVSQGEGNRDQIVLRGISSSSDFFVNGIRDDQERFRISITSTASK